MRADCEESRPDPYRPNRILVTNSDTKLATKQMPGHLHGRAMPMLNNEKHASDRKTAIMLATIGMLVVSGGSLRKKTAPMTPSTAPSRPKESRKSS